MSFEKQMTKLLTTSADPKMMRSKVVCDLQMAIRTKNFDQIVSILMNKLESVSDLNRIQFIDKSTPVSSAIYNGFDICVQLLLDFGFSPNKVSTDSIGRIEPPLCTAIRLGNFKVINILVNHMDIDVNRCDCFGQTPVYLCVRYRLPQIIPQIIRHNSFDLNCRTFLVYNACPLWLSVTLLHMNRFECFKILINIGFKVQKEMIDVIRQSHNEIAIKLVEMSIGTVLSIDRQQVFTLKQICRSVIRNILLEVNCRPIIIENLGKQLPELPDYLNHYLSDLTVF